MGSGLGICWQAHAASSAKKIKIEVGSDVFLTLELVTCHSTSAPDAFPPPLQGCVWSLERGVSHRCAPAALLGGTGQQAFSSQNKGKVKTIFFQKNCRKKKMCLFTQFSCYLRELLGGGLTSSPLHVGSTIYFCLLSQLSGASMAP